MSSRTSVPSRWFTHTVVVTAGLCLLGIVVGVAWAGIGGFRNSAVGGISISADGVVGTPTVDARKGLLELLRREVKSPEGALAEATQLRMISLKALNAACEKAVKDNYGELPEEIKYLAGLQRIEYVFVYPEEQDIVLAGPGEGWRVDEKADVVGVTSGRPVMQLEDLLIALRSVHEARLGGISCSIDPTPEGLAALRQVLDRQRGHKVNPPVLEAAIKRAFGPQMVKIQGVPATSHFARVMVAADYRMKRLAMELEPSPVRGLPSYIDLIKQAGPRAANNASPRWWLACNYEPLATTDDGLAWQLRGPGVKAMTEESFLAADGSLQGTGKTSAAAQKWADLMTKRYDELSQREAVFGELRNVMDMCVVAALLEKERLWDRAGLSAPVLRQPQSELKPKVWHAPKLVPPEVSFTYARNAWIVTASGAFKSNRGKWPTAKKSCLKSLNCATKQNRTAKPCGGSNLKPASRDARDSWQPARASRTRR